MTILSDFDKMPRKRAVSLTIREDILEQARALDLNASRAAESGIAAAVKAARQEQWLAQARKGLDAHNARIAEKGPLITPHWADE